MTRHRVVYLVSRFPVTSETFIVREMEELFRSGDVDIELRSLFPSADTAIHDLARRWSSRLIRPGLLAVAAGLIWVLVARPRAAAAVVGTVAGAYRTKPALLVRALVTTAIACAHARDLAAQQQPPHIHAHYATYPALTAWVCHQLIGATYSFTAHAHDLYVDQTMLRRKITDATFVVTISEYNRALLCRLNTGHTHVEMVHCGIDTTGYHYRPRSVPATGPVRAVVVASLQTYKGHAVLLRALSLGGPAVGRIDLEVIGDGVLRGELQRLTAELNLKDRVQFRGSRSESEVKAALDQADLFVLPSVVAPDGQMEGLPVALMEALACGIPTVSTALSGIPEIVIDGVTGLLAEPGDVASLHSALTSMIESGPEALEYTSAGRELVMREFDLRQSTQALGRLLQRTVCAPSAGCRSDG